MSRQLDIPENGDVRPTREEIERRAYEIYLARGGQNGNDVADWIMAEQELMAGSVAHLTVASNTNGGARHEEQMAEVVAIEPEQQP